MLVGQVSFQTDGGESPDSLISTVGDIAFPAACLFSPTVHTVNKMRTSPQRYNNNLNSSMMSCLSSLVKHCLWHYSFMYEIGRRKAPFEKKTHLTQMYSNTSGLFQICPLCQNSLRNLFLTNFQSSRPKQYLAHLPISLSPKTQYRDSSPSCLK